MQKYSSRIDEDIDAATIIMVTVSSACVAMTDPRKFANGLWTLPMRVKCSISGNNFDAFTHCEETTQAGHSESSFSLSEKTVTVDAVGRGFNHEVTLQDVFYAIDIICNLIACLKVQKEGFSIVIDWNNKATKRSQMELWHKLLSEVRTVGFETPEGPYKAVLNGQCVERAHVACIWIASVRHQRLGHCSSAVPTTSILHGSRIKEKRVLPASGACARWARLLSHHGKHSRAILRISYSSASL